MRQAQGPPPDFIPGPVFTIEGPPEPPSTTGRRVAAILVPALTLAVLIALAVLFLTGTVRFGTTSVTAVTLASKVDASGRPLDSKARFTDEDASVYCCANVRAFASTRLESKWFLAGKQVSSTRSTYAKMAGTPPARFVTSRGRVCFRLERPSGGWAGGPYSVKVFLNGKQAAQKDFMISEARPDGMVGLRYTDPSGLFSIVVPEGWRAAEKSSLGGALAGFMAPAGQAAYTPRFAVSLTDFESADVEYLNRAIGPAGATTLDSFVPYAIGELAGARRTFEWDFSENGQVHRLRTIQVVVQTPQGVFSIDCHSLASDFTANEPVFNAIVNTFR